MKFEKVEKSLVLWFSDKAIHGILTANDSPRPYGVSHTVSKTSSTKRTAPVDDKLKKRGSQISKELSDMVVYVQVIILLLLI